MRRRRRKSRKRMIRESSLEEMSSRQKEIFINALESSYIKGVSLDNIDVFPITRDEYEVSVSPGRRNPYINISMANDLLKSAGAEIDACGVTSDGGFFFRIVF